MNTSHPKSMAKRSFRTISVARMRVAAGLAAVVGLGAAAVTMASCTADDGVRPRGNTIGAGGGTSGSGVGTSSGDVNPNAPCVDGATTDCHMTVGVNDGILTCFHGERTCVNGFWGPCSNGEFSGKMDWSSSSAAATESSDSHILSLTDAGPCETNPCDPNCQDYEEVPDAGYKVVPVQVSIYYAADPAQALSTIPSGFQTKGLSEPCILNPAAGQGSGCEFDTYCATNTPGVTQCLKATSAATCCVAWKAGEFNKNCAKPDATSSFACTLNGVPTIPVCNRGSVVLPAPTRIHIFPGNSTQFPVCNTDNAPYVCDTTQPVAPGKCLNLTGCPKLQGNGTVSYMVNPAATANVNTPANPNYRDECRCDNNWSVWAGDSTTCQTLYNYDAQPIVKNQTYQAICPAGTRPQWQYLTWNTTTPGNSNVIWEGRVASTSAGLSSASYANLGTAKVTPTPDTHICAAAGPTGCPINLFTTFGDPGAYNQYLELRITINPTTDLTQGAAVNNWQVSYSCPPSQ